MAKTTAHQWPVRRRLGLLVRAVPRIRRRPRSGGADGDTGTADRTRLAVRAGILSLRLDLMVDDPDDAVVALDRVLATLRPGDRVYVVGPPGVAGRRVDERPFTIWA
ncbi:hypothetical protein ACIG47_16775 [Promicromonospora sp. NPDC052451]|uniref:hypothetical protein n=1 Tax=Promicromonospora sp. NPDC052451 TaxID=3364407 RepID=UPI0037C55716